ncbi:hypothetical protein PsorP6_003053 [Peronosclerospora sorghi]|uniref:Uncharacterized protein n=1 Tax=Peronosclerospora sorghi TaxID=230839 RepID=A0ACC0VMW7_9STRA|nr:hypothetical protein PsorP6_003053 [Peronosclerospora sorghi]
MTPQRNESPQWIIYVRSTFASSCLFFTFRSTKHSACVVAVDTPLEACTLKCPCSKLQDLARASSTQNVTTCRRLETLLVMRKRLVIAIFHSNNEFPGIRQLQQLQNVTVIIHPTIDSLCEQLHEVDHQERTQGYELPSSHAVVPILPLFFRTALSQSFRFKNFTAKQVPVLRLNVMHWRRMLPWISESTAQDIETHLK